MGSRRLTQNFNDGFSCSFIFAQFQWEAIIADDLVGNALILTSVIVGGIMGLVGLLLEATTDFFDDAGGNSRMIAFWLSFIVGLAICSILLSTVSSGVNTVIVMFADAPNEFERSHPELSRKMRETWREYYPGSV